MFAHATEQRIGDCFGSSSRRWGVNDHSSAGRASRCQIYRTDARRGDLHVLAVFGFFILALQVYPLTAQAGDAWQFRLTPCLWFAGLEGDVPMIPGTPAAAIDISPSDAIEDTETSLMLLIDAKRGRHGVFRVGSLG